MLIPVPSPYPPNAQSPPPPPADDTWRTPTWLFAKLSRLVRAAFVFEYQWLRRRENPNPGEYIPPAEWDGLPASKSYRVPVWPAVALWCLEQAVDPLHYIRETLPLMKESERNPRKLLIPSMRSRYEDTHPLHRWKDEARRSIPIQKNQLQTMVTNRIDMADATEQQTLRCLLLDPGTPFSVLFRYAKAVERQEAEVAQHFEPAALLDYICGIKAYEGSYGAILPERFTRGARELREQMLRSGLRAITGAKPRKGSRREAS